MLGIMKGDTGDSRTLANITTTLKKLMMMKKFSLFVLLAFLPLVTRSQTTIQVQGAWYGLCTDPAVCKVRVAEFIGPESRNITSFGVASQVVYNHESYIVTTMRYRCFGDCVYLTSVSIPSTITDISGAFMNCSSLTSISIPNSVSDIGADTFWGCSSLTSISIPNSVSYLGPGAFYQCSSLTSVTLSNNLETLPRWVFYECSKLPSVTIPNSVTNIEDEAFRGCSSLTSVDIPNSVKNLGKGAFRECSSLTSVTIPNSITEIGECAFMDCSSLTSVTIPNSISIIDELSFYGCSSLKSLTIPSSVSAIWVSAFAEMSSLKNVYCYAEDVPKTHEYAFFSSSIESATLHVPAASVELYKESYPWNQFMSIVPLGSEMLGDANCDGIVDMRDIDIIAEFIMKGKVDSFSFENADANGDYKVDVADIVTILNIINNTSKKI